MQSFANTHTKKMEGVGKGIRGRCKMENIGGCISPVLSNSSKEKNHSPLCHCNCIKGETVATSGTILCLCCRCNGRKKMQSWWIRCFNNWEKEKWREQQSRKLKTRNTRLITQSVRKKQGVCLFWHQLATPDNPTLINTGQTGKGVTRRCHEISRGQQRWWESIKRS